MKVHFISSRESINKDIITLRRIISLVKDSGHTLAIDWIEKAYERQTNSADATVNWRDIFRENLETIAEADVIIAETSYENFGVGYQIATAVHQKKPVLLLRHEEADKNAFVTGVEDGWVRQEKYSEDNVEDIIKKFLEENDITVKDMRFNFFIDRPIYNYLRWAAFRTGKTKAEILRELVQREIEKKDY